MAVRAETLAVVEAAFAAGRDRPAAETEASSGRTYGALFFAELRRRLPAEDAAFFEEWMNGQHAALVASRRDELDDARAAFAALRERIRAQPLSPEARALATAFLEPAEAYHRYKLRAYDEALALVLHASSLDGALAEGGFTIMSAHRLQLGLNAGRIYAAAGAPHEAARLAGAFVDYLERRTPTVSAELTSPRALLDSVPEEIAAMYVDKFVGEFSMLVASRDDAQARALFAPLAHHAASCPHRALGEHAHAWLEAKALALAGDELRFERAIVALLARGRETEPLLWFASVLDALAWLRARGAEAAERADRIAQEVASLRDAPWLLRAQPAATAPV